MSSMVGGSVGPPVGNELFEERYPRRFCPSSAFAACPSGSEIEGRVTLVRDVDTVIVAGAAIRQSGADRPKT